MNSKPEGKTYWKSILPMVLSMILLSLFVGYFNYSEFVKEKEAMTIEDRYNVFVKVFSDLEEGKDVPLGLDSDKTIRWLKDTINGEEKIRLGTTDDNYFRNKEVKQNDSIIVGLLKGLKSNDDFLNSNRTHNVFDKLSGLDEKDKMNIEVVYDNKEDSFDIRTVTHFGEGQRFLKPDHEIKTIDVLKRIWFQILFSLFLLGLVFFTFYIILKNLRKEERLSEMRNDFMQNMSHELKTPVSTIGVALEALSNFNAADNANLRKEYINISRIEVARLGLLVDKALNLSLYEQGKFVFDNQIIQLDEELENIMQTMKPHIESQNVKIQFNRIGNAFAVRGDKSHLVNVIHNLIENGIKYSKDQPEIEIRLKEKDTSIELSIRDNGVGIAPEYQAKIFDKFFRVPEGNKHNVKGHGLGLSYVKEVLKELNGDIKLKSGIDTGSTFIITLPKEK